MSADYHRRDLVIALSRTDAVNARNVALGIEYPWLRAQAFAWIAYYADARYRDTLIQESLIAARKCRPRHAAMCSAWIVAALAARQFHNRAARVAREFVDAMLRDRAVHARAQGISTLWFAALDRGVVIDEEWAYSLSLVAANELADSGAQWAMNRLRLIVVALGDSGMAAARAKISQLPLMARRPFTLAQQQDARRQLRRELFAEDPRARFECWKTPGIASSSNELARVRASSSLSIVC